MKLRHPTSLIACLFLAALSISMADARLQAADVVPPLVPWPQQVSVAAEKAPLQLSQQIVSLQPELRPLAEIVAAEIAEITGKKLTAGSAASAAGDIVLSIDAALKPEAYRLAVTDRVTIVGGSYRAVAWGTSTLLQAVELRDDGLVIPPLTIFDEPVAEFRGLLVDVARQDHSVELLKLLVRMCRYYKINFMQLHLTDSEAFTFPSTAYPKLATPNRHYTLEELKDLVAFAEARGVSVIPELEVPGHAGAMSSAMPELFGSLDEAGKPRSLGGCLNMANEAVYPALETIVKELCEVFHTSPYIHIGADEVWLEHIKLIPEWQTYKKTHDLKSDHDVYYHCINRMHEIVKRQGRKTLVWEGFNDRGQVKISKDVIVMIFENAYFPADAAANAGYTLINTSWQPIYVVNRKKWPASNIYAWNYRLWKTVHDTSPPTEGTQLPPEAPVLGAMMCAWEQVQTIEISSLRPRLSAMSERIWNPGAGRSLADYEDRFRRADTTLARMIAPVSISAEGFVAVADYPPYPSYFHNLLTVRLSSLVPGEIRYTIEGTDPTRESSLYERPIELEKSAVVKARAYDAAGEPRGYIEWCEYTEITPAVTYEYYKAPASGWKTMPDLTGLKPGSTGLLDKFRSFALDPNYVMLMQGQVKIPVSGEYEISVRLNDAEATLSIGDQRAFTFKQPGSGKQWWEAETFKVALKEGVWPARLEYLSQAGPGFIEILVKPPGSDKFSPLTLLPLELPTMPASN